MLVRYRQEAEGSFFFCGNERYQLGRGVLICTYAEKSVSNWRSTQIQFPKGEEEEFKVRNFHLLLLM